MANRDFKKIERIIKDFTSNVEAKGTSSGGMILVNELPEVGKEDTLYKTPDGKIWSCTNTTTEETICDLEVGKSFKLVERNLLSVEDAQSIVDAVNAIGWKTSDSTADIFFNGEGNRPTGYMAVDTTVIMNVEINENSYVSYEGNNEAELHNLSELPSIEITQQFVTDITTAGLELMDWTFLFQNSAHTEEVTTSTWTEVGSGGSEVVANPELVGDEPDLTGLEVDGTKYKVPEGGSSSFVHFFAYGNEPSLSDMNFSFIIVNNYPMSMGVSGIKTYLSNLGCSYDSGNWKGSKFYPASGLDYGGNKVIGISIAQNYGSSYVVAIHDDKSEGIQLQDNRLSETVLSL